MNDDFNIFNLSYIIRIISNVVLSGLYGINNNNNNNNNDYLLFLKSYNTILYWLGIGIDKNILNKSIDDNFIWKYILYNNIVNLKAINKNITISVKIINMFLY